MSVLYVIPSGTNRDWNDVIKAPNRFDGFLYGDDSLEFFDLTHRVEWAPPAAAAGGGAMLDPLHRYVSVKNMGVDPVLLHLNTQANSPNEAYEVTILPGMWVEYVDLWMTVQPSIRVDSALYSSAMECEVLQVGEFTPITDIPQEFCDLWTVGHFTALGCLTKHNPEIPGPWELVTNPLEDTEDHWLADVAGVDEDDYWAVGYVMSGANHLTGILDFWNGVVWAEDETDTPPFYGVWGFSASNYYAVGGDDGGPAEVWHNAPAGVWEQDCVPDPDNDDVLYCVHGDVPALVYAAGQDGLITDRRLGVWAVHPPPLEHETDNLYGTWTSSAQVPYICGGDKEWYDDTGGNGMIITEAPPGSTVWQDFPLPFGCPTLRAMWGFNDSDIWAVGDAGWILHYDGAAWTRIPEPASLETNYNYRGVFGCWPWGVWAVGTNYAGGNVIIFWDGLTWTIDDGPTAQEGELLGLKGVWVSS